MKATDAPCPVKMPKKEAASPGSPPSFRHHFSLDFPNTNNPNGNLLHIQTNCPVLSSMQGPRNSAMRGGPCPQVAHSLSEESEKTCYKLSHRNTEQSGKAPWRR